MKTARELHYITGRPMSSIYRLMDECSTKTCRYEEGFGLRLYVDENEFRDICASKKRGNPRFSKVTARQIEKGFSKW